MAMLNDSRNSDFGRYSAQTVTSFAQFLYDSAAHEARPPIPVDNLLIEPLHSTGEYDVQDIRYMAVAYFVSGIIFASIINAIYQKRTLLASQKTISPPKESIEESVSKSQPEETKHHDLGGLGIIDYNRPDYKEKIKHWQSYKNNYLEPFKPDPIYEELEEFEDQYLQINVLLIDSGIDATHEALKFREENIQPWHDYTDTNSMEGGSTAGSGSSLVDDFGHGTCGADIIGSISESAVIYSARVSKDGRNVEPTIVAKAISDAVNKMGEIEFHFIIMPLAFPEDCEGLDELEKAINDAAEMGITLIAAAGNVGNCRDPQPPACYPSVICALSCDGRGTPSGFSPSIRLAEGDQREFLVPGEGIECAWIQPGRCHRQERNELQGLGRVLTIGPDEKRGFTYVSGTSFACSVLGGISMVVLEKVYEIALREHNDPESANSKVNYIRKHFLRDILSQMTRPERRAYLLAPTQVTVEVLQRYLDRARAELDKLELNHEWTP
ncbi:hypothetical protein TWF718_002146 [Orbilia javanica]|uniref:Peptidase S8/S53 domain-containing protein n=1 Tax=Orbilia javanica TaxID=47235 RepID=A0AAN8MMW5_9PEZI